ncbi:MAG: 2-hydroxyglutaryl-CoA dehydratase [Spirochaetes bacterium]|nr:2-hydroxyglutaryl-CoA dehydratase [Spirochaetota bacterium]
MLTAGLDIGSVSTEMVILKDGEVICTHIIPTGSNSKRAAEEVFEKTCKKASLKRSSFDFIVTTGYGRKAVVNGSKNGDMKIGDKAVTELSCHARGAYELDNEIRTVIDIGGQDSKVIKVGPGGKGLDFVMNDKCAAGTGKFLEVMARTLDVTVEQMGEIALSADTTAAISSMCTVFAESEVVSLIAEGCPKESIISGLMDAVAARVCGMAHRVGLERKVMLTGGVAKNKGVVNAMKKKIKMDIEVSGDPQIVGALGAAFIARDEAVKTR